MVERPYWIEKLNTAWKSRSLIWLSGVRRSGKTTLSKMLPGANYFNCDLPSVSRQLDDPEFIYQNLHPDSVIIFDEIHKLKDPSRILKIGDDERIKSKQ